MSYDVSIGAHSFNYTSNLSKLFHACISDNEGKTGIAALDGKTGAVAASILAGAFDAANNLHARVWTVKDGATKFRETYDAPNGWGDVEGGLIFMARIMAACQANARKRVRVCA
jgi:hypothetical protein